jgi:hypothetical protein
MRMEDATELIDVLVFNRTSLVINRVFIELIHQINGCWWETNVKKTFQPLVLGWNCNFCIGHYEFIYLFM